jgi:hypothetical protein
VSDDCNNSASCEQIITVQDCPSPPPRLIALDNFGGGKMEITIQAELDRTYLIEATEDFQRWRSIASVLNTNGKLSFTDPTPTTKCFYRISLQP